MTSPAPLGRHPRTSPTPQLVADLGDHLSGPALEVLSADPDGRPADVLEAPVPGDIALPLDPVRTVLVALVLDDDLLFPPDQVADGHERAVDVEDRGVERRLGQAGHDEQYPRPGLLR